MNFFIKKGIGENKINEIYNKYKNILGRYGCNFTNKVFKRSATSIGSNSITLSQ